MKLNEIKLVNFRNYDSLELSFSPFLNIIYGLNGSGKTNLVESIYLLSLAKSFRISNEKVMIKSGSIKAKVMGEIDNDGYVDEYELQISDEGKNVFVSGNKIDKLSDYIGRINVVLFNPSDTRLIEDAPEKRRKLINIEISSIYKDYLIVLNNYNKILKQRNFYIRGMYVNGSYTNTYLDILTKKLVEYGIVICRYRKEFIDKINEYITDIYGNIFNDSNLKVRYNSVYKNKNSEELVNKYKKNYQKELSIGKTIDGIHHDDIEFIVDDKSLKDWGSEGQRKNAIIAFKLALIKVIKQIKGYYPILILDDLFSELDKEKVSNILKILDSNVQTFITTTDLKNFNKKIINNAYIFRVNNGVIEKE